MKILYIEDNPADIDLTLHRLKKTAPHIHVDIARSQTEALEKIKTAKVSDYDLVLTDMNLQDGDGIAILSHIRAHSIPVSVVLLTGQGDEESAVAALKAGADDYLVKKKGYLDSLPQLLEKALISYREIKSTQLHTLNVLYVEHNEADVDLALMHFKKHAAHIRMNTISSVAVLYEKLENGNYLSKYDVLMLDYRLPQENALEILKRIQFSEHQKIPVILITGKGDEEIAVKALKLGAFDYVTKIQGYLFKLPSVIENAYYSMRLTREHEALLESASRYRSLFEENHLAMLLTDPENGHIVDANSAASRFYGWSKEELKQKTIHEINTLPTEELNKEIDIVLDRKQDYFLFKHQRSDGSICDVEVYSGPIELEGRHLIYSMIYNITERLKIQKEKELLQKQLIQAQKMESFGQLAGGIAHDFNNILSSIIGFTELALGQVQNGSPIEDDLQEVYSAGKRAKDLVKQILAFARQSDEEIKPIQISLIIEEVFKLIKASTPANIQIQYDYDSEASIMGNGTQIHQVVMNLCTNAIHAMENKGGILKISLSDVINPSETSKLNLKSDCYLKLNISDTGMGIPAEIIDTIFEPYFTTKALGEGTGMGLAMVHGIIEGYGGKICVKSEIDKGSIFTIYLPITGECLPHLLFESERLEKGSEKILFIDDEISIAKMGEKMLSRLGYSVTTMTSSVEALDLFKKKAKEFDLIITDMTMPSMTGDILGKKILKIRPDIPIILCTGFSRIMSDKQADDIGIKAFVHKPIVQNDLARTVRQVLDEAKNSNK